MCIRDRFFRDKRIIVNDGSAYYSFTAVDEIVSRTSIDFYAACQREEADTRIFYHIAKFDLSKNIVVKCSGTDVLVILLGNWHKIVPNSKIWLEAGRFNDNTLRHVNVINLYSALRGDICHALPGFHAFTGSDTTSCLFKKGKVAPFKKIVKSADFVDYFKTFENFVAITNMGPAEEYLSLIHISEPTRPY